MIFLEPRGLTIIRTLTRHLKIEPLLRMVCVVAARSVAELAISVVLLDKILDDGTGFPQRKISVWLIDRWHASVGVNFEKNGLLDILEADWDNLVGKTKFFNHHGNFGWIGTTLAPDLDRFDGR